MTRKKVYVQLQPLEIRKFSFRLYYHKRHEDTYVHKGKMEKMPSHGIWDEHLITQLETEKKLIKQH